MKYQFKIPQLPPSSNEMYIINFRQRRVVLHPKASAFKYQVKLFTPRMTFPHWSLLAVHAEYHANWFTKNEKKPKRRDAQNFNKLLYDAIFEKISIDDSFAFSGSWAKIQNDSKEFTLVTLTTVELRRNV